MTPAEKAKSLLFAMKRCQSGPGIEAAEGNAKKSALLCCDEIISDYERLKEDAMLYLGEEGIKLAAKDSVNYWESVKSSIQIL